MRMKKFKSMLLPEDLEKAADDLLSLKRTSPMDAVNVAIRVLNEHLGDEHYQAFAFDVYYSLAKDEALDWVVAHAGDASPAVVGAMLSAVAEDSGIANEVPKLKAAIAALKNETKPSWSESKRMEQVASWFNETYPDS